jgi:GNAT superfamily N-acetyltransferase
MLHWPGGPRSVAASSSADVRYVSELFDGHDTSAFRCGNDVLDEWLQRSAGHAAAMNTGRTFVWHTGGRAVVAYFTLAAHVVRRDRIPKRVGRGSPDEIPAVLLARLALEERLHGQGLGGELLWDALSRTLAASKIVAARLVVVDAIDEAAAGFYKHHGFTRCPDPSHRLVQKMSDIAVALGMG